jgi:hypothetical protein
MQRISTVKIASNMGQSLFLVDKDTLALEFEMRCLVKKIA